MSCLTRGCCDCGTLLHPNNSTAFLSCFLITQLVLFGRYFEFFVSFGVVAGRTSVYPLIFHSTTAKNANEYFHLFIYSLFCYFVYANVVVPPLRFPPSDLAPRGRKMPVSMNHSCLPNVSLDWLVLFLLRWRDYWARFEKFIRDLLKVNEAVFVVTGPLWLPHKAKGGWVMAHPMIGGSQTYIVVIVIIISVTACNCIDN